MVSGSRTMKRTIILVLGLSLICSIQGQRCIAPDEATLLEFKRDFHCEDVDNPTILCPIDSWIAGTDCCEWDGVTCDSLGRVKGLLMGAFFKPGPRLFQLRSGVRDFGKSLPKLKELQDLEFQFVGVDTTLPRAWGSITKLKRLLIEHTTFVGELPSEFGKLSNLEVLHIDTVAPGLFGDGLNGTKGIPRELCKLSKLKFFVLRNHPRLSGGLPSCIDGWRSIETIDFNNEDGKSFEFRFLPAMTGLLPDTIGSLTNLKVLNLAGNNFGGWVPRSLGHLTKLQRLNLAANRLTGKIPKEFGYLRNLEFLDLHSNKMFGEVPPQLGNLKLLQLLHLHNNGFYGAIPKGVYNLPSLNNLRLDTNRFWGPLPRAEGSRDMSIHFSLNVSSNFLDGPLNARELPRNIAFLYMSSQNGRMAFTRIPSTISVLKNLAGLDLSNNQLVGKIPGTFNDLPMLRNSVDLSDNDLEGTVPAILKRPGVDLSGNPRLIL